MFKNIILGIFIAGALIGMAVFGGLIHVGGSSTATTKVLGKVTIWGTFPEASMRPFLADFQNTSGGIFAKYVEKDPSTFSNDIIESIASGTPPDLIILPDNLINHFKDKLIHIPFTTLPADTYTNTYISAANIFSSPDGTLALPWASDPLIMYYNRDMLQSAGIAKPPTNWQDFTDSIKLLTVKQSNLTITQSATALGAYNNIAHAKDILALLFMQTGNPFMAYDYANFVAYFGGGGTPNEGSTAVQVMNFYSSFADPVKSVYSWNAGEPLDRSMFNQSSMAYYFGTASELPGIRAANPNLNFGIALPPQSVAGTTLTTGRMYGFAVPKAVKNPTLSITTALLLTNAVSEKSLSDSSALTLALLPVRRDVLANNKGSDPYLNFLYKAVLVQKSWFDPAPVESDQILSNMVRDINSSVLTPEGALGKAETQLEAISTKQ